ncbi:MAG: hypothetical protein R2822_24200 [Spirosomataceae bacterium]
MYSQIQIEYLVAEVLGMIEVQTDTPKLTVIQKQKVLSLGNELTHQVMNSSLSDWAILGILQKMASDKPLSTTEKKDLKTKLYQLIRPSLLDKNSAIHSLYSNDKKLEKAFWKNLQ